MCGIFATISQTDQTAAQTILQGLKTLEYRGYDSWGISILDQSGELQTEKHVGKIGRAQTKLGQSSIGLGHTRWATHGGVTVENAHPHLDCSQTLALVHNGIVENYRELKEKLEQDGHEFLSETDSEVVVHLIEELQKKYSFDQAVMKAFKRLEGANAILVLDAKSSTVVAVKNSSPLLVGKKDKSVYFASDVTALVHHTQEIYTLEDEDVIVATPSSIKRYNVLSGLELPLQFSAIEIDQAQIEKGSFPHFLLKEIHEQPQVINQLAEFDFEANQDLKKTLQTASQIILIGCGSAYHCSLLGTYFLNNAQILAHAYQAHEFQAFVPSLKSGTLVIAISQSGETIDTLLACKAAQKAGAKIVGVVNARHSSLERLADFVLPVGAGPEIAVVSTKAFLAQVSMLYLLSALVSSDSSSLHSVGAELKKLAATIEKLFENEAIQKQIQQLVRTLEHTQSVFVIGKGLNYLAALETALKIKENTYVHAEGFAAGELKHGVLSLIEPGTPTLVLTNNDALAKDTWSNATEIKARGGKIISFSPQQFDIADQQFVLDDIGPLNALLNIVIGQLIAYHLAVHKQLDPDKPRNLAKSVTVK